MNPSPALTLAFLTHYDVRPGHSFEDQDGTWIFDRADEFRYMRCRRPTDPPGRTRRIVRAEVFIDRCNLAPA